MIKKLLAIILVIILAASVSACGSDNKAAVYWLNFKPELDETLRVLAEEYTEQTGVSVKIVTAASGSYETTLTSELDKSSPPTLFVIGNQQGVKDWGEFALDLRGSAIENELINNDYCLYDEDGRLVSIGYCYECYGIIANPDLIKDSGHSMEEIKDFDGLKTVVEDIHSRADELGFDAFTSCDMDESSSWRFTGHMANLEYYYEARDDGGWDECPAQIKGTYLSNYKNLYDLCINNSLAAPTSLATGGHDAENEFCSEKAAFFVNGSWEYNNIVDAVPNAVMLPYYCGVKGEENAGLNCGTENCWAVNALVSEEKQKATIDFMVWLVSDPYASQALVDALGILPYKNAAESSNAFLKEAAEYSDKGCYVMDWVTNFQPNVNEYRKDLVSALNAYNAHQSDANWELVRDAFVNGWAKQYALINGR